jgi:hypothetical protein
MIFPVLLAKLLSAGTVAQAAAGAGIVVVAVTGAGVAGVLPDPLQDTVATAVETVTPFELTDDDETLPEDGSTGEEPLPETTPVVEEPTDEDVVDELPAEDAEFSAAAWAEEGPDAYPSFGAWVSEGARHGAHKELGVRFGELVSSRAREKGLDAEELEAEGVDLDALTDVTTEPAPEEETEVAQTEPQDESAVATPQRGNGKAAGGNGNANSNGNGGGKSSGNAGGKGNGRN